MTIFAVELTVAVPRQTMNRHQTNVGNGDGWVFQGLHPPGFAMCSLRLDEAG